MRTDRQDVVTDLARAGSQGEPTDDDIAFVARVLDVIAKDFVVCVNCGRFGPAPAKPWISCCPERKPITGTQVVELHSEVEELRRQIALLQSDLDDTRAKYVNANMLAATWTDRYTKVANGYSTTQHEISQALGRALGYPRYADDQENFPGADDSDGVCVGELLAEDLASLAAREIESLKDRCRSAETVVAMAGSDDAPMGTAFERPRMRGAALDHLRRWRPDHSLVAKPAGDQ